VVESIEAFFMPCPGLAS